MLQWGGFMVVVMTASDLMRKTPFPRASIDYAFDIALNLIVWPIAGYFFGISMWSFYETYFGEDQMLDSSGPVGSK